MRISRIISRNSHGHSRTAEERVSGVYRCFLVIFAVPEEYIQLMKHIRAVTFCPLESCMGNGRQGCVLRPGQYLSAFLRKQLDQIVLPRPHQPSNLCFLPTSMLAGATLNIESDKRKFSGRENPDSTRGPKYSVK